MVPPNVRLGVFLFVFFSFFSFGLEHCYDIAIAQMNYPSLNKQDSIKQVRTRSHEKVLVQISMLDITQFGRVLRLSRL